MLSPRRGKSDSEYAMITYLLSFLCRCNLYIYICNHMAFDEFLSKKNVRL